MAQDNIITIKKSLAEITSKATPKIVKSSVNKIIKELKDYINRLENIYNNIESDAQKTLGIAEAIDASQLTTSYNLYKKLNKYDDDIVTILKEGYILIDEIRTFFTGEKILYDIGFTYRGAENLYEMQLTMEEILSYTIATYNTKSKLDNLYKLRMSVKKGDLVAKYNESRQEMLAEEEGSTTLCSSIARYTQQKAPIKMCNVYEAYKVYSKLQDGKNRIPPAEWDQEQFDTILEEVKKNIASSTKGGDLENIQIKFFGRSAPSLMTTANVRRTLNDILNIFQGIQSGKNENEIIQEVQKIFLKDHEVDSITGKIEEAGLEKAENFLKERINKIVKVQ